MNNLKRNIARFFLKHRDKGIPNLMLYIAIGNALVCLLSLTDPNLTVLYWLNFNPTLILKGQVWRLVSFVFAPMPRDIINTILSLLMLYFYYRIGQMLEQKMGTLKFNLFYLTGVLLLAAVGMIFHWPVTTSDLNLSLILAFATLAANAQVLYMFFIPLKIKYLAWLYLGLTMWQCYVLRSALPVVPILNFFLFFWGDLENLLPDWARRNRPKKNYRTAPPPPPKQKPNPNWADEYRSKSGEAPYRHKCSVCGKTDTQYPQLEFRYCSRCTGYRCYCMEHINNHEHVQ